MQRNRVTILGSSVAMGLAAMLSAGAGSDVVTIERERPVNAKRRHVAPSVWANGRSKYEPHIGKKEQERAKRCYMVNVFGGLANPHNKNPRSAPTLSQASQWFRNYPF
ncbi:MAG: hypothetical protein JWR07_281 [Nevskia sp.]|nr:hypothetical protein [Nevskia sp.]